MSKIEYVKIDSIQKHPNNPRFISEEAIEELKKSIQNFEKMLEYRPILVDKETGYILGGNQRWEACKRLGKTQVPVIFITDLDEEKKKELLLKDNIQFGEWDYEELKKGFTQEELITFGLEDARYISFDTDEDFEFNEDEQEDTEPEEEENVIKKLAFLLDSDDYEDTLTKLTEYIDYHELNDVSEALIHMLEREEQDE